MNSLPIEEDLQTDGQTDGQSEDIIAPSRPIDPTTSGSEFRNQLTEVQVVLKIIHKRLKEKTDSRKRKESKKQKGTSQPSMRLCSMQHVCNMRAPVGWPFGDGMVVSSWLLWIMGGG